MPQFGLRIMRKVGKIGVNKRVPRSKKGHRLDWLPDQPDRDDVKYSAPPSLKEIPSKTNNRSNVPFVMNQLDIGSCVANATAQNIHILQKRQCLIPGKQDMEYCEGRLCPVSRLFAYYNARTFQGWEKEDTGCFLRDCIKGLWTYGVPEEELWTYHRLNTFRKPDLDAYKQAKDYKIDQYLRLGGFRQMKECLAEGFPFSFGFIVYDSFDDPEVFRTGRVTMPKKHDRRQGGHAVCAIDYDDDYVSPDNEQGGVLCVNSWSDRWGDKGFFWLPYAYLKDNDLCDDFWVIKGNIGPD